MWGKNGWHRAPLRQPFLIAQFVPAGSVLQPPVIPPLRRSEHDSDDDRNEAPVALDGHPAGLDEQIGGAEAEADAGAEVPTEVALPRVDVRLPLDAGAALRSCRGPEQVL